MKTLIGCRLITLVCHLIVAALFLSNRDFNVRVCIPWDYNEDQYRLKDVELIVGLSLTIATVVIESFGFFSGITMLSTAQCLFSFCLHSIGALFLLAFMLDGWPCHLLWWLFALTALLPLMAEVVLVGRAILLAGRGGVYSNKR